MKQNGFGDLISILFLSILGTLIVATLSLKVLVGIERTSSLSDTLKSTYSAESDINDILARLIKDFSIDLSDYPKTLADGTKLSITEQRVGEEIVYDITASRPYSSFKLELRKGGTSSTIPQQTDIAIALDCTGSMDSCADDPNDNRCKNPTSSRPTSLEALRDATVSFLQALQAMPNANVRIGLLPFTFEPIWMKTLDGRVITPDANIPLQDIIDTVQNGFKKTVAASPNCRGINSGGTNQASALHYLHDYFSANPSITTKQIEVVITDGQPTAAVPDAACYEDYLITYAYDPGICPVYQPQSYPGIRWNCKPHAGSPGGYASYSSQDPSYLSTDHANSHLKCVLTPSDRIWNGIDAGKRDPNIDSFFLTTYQLPASDPVRTIVEDASTGYFGMDDATDLTDTLINELLPAIESSVNSFRIRRVIP